MSSVLEDSAVGDKQVTLTGTASLDKCRFNCGPGMQKQWTESNSLFLNVVGSRFSQSVKASFEAGELVTTKVDESMIPRFDAEEDMNDHMADLKHWKQELNVQSKENHSKLRTVML